MDTKKWLTNGEKWTRLDDICAPICLAGLLWLLGGIYCGANGFAILTGIILVLLAISIDLLGRAFLFIFKGGK